ncbi:hypothetical protein KP509_27G007300 [Ceratopteris richardii]|uniref:Retrovirus-related Pol polyprotein from transposon TNT 1-94-like beta-barrel domain-containing protein n=1 Tax=Ceratopteris richardii TaxID=49495 RepID=A0A8T2RDL6_CERRI|nr:hypothetical protein KP509_27G007300 [Ceratopteris richardii]
MANGDGMTQLMSDKLDKNNFHAWRFRMTNFLMGKGYWKYIEGENENASHIQDSMIGHIQDAKTPKEAWNILVTLYETNTKARKLQLKNELHTLEKKCMSVSEKKLVRGYVETNDNTSHPIKHTRNIALSMEDGKVKHLADVLHVPNITKNLVSVGQMVDQGLQVRFNVDGLYVEEYKWDARLIAKGNKLLCRCQEGINLEPNDKENVEKASAKSQVLSGPDASPSNSSNSNPWSGRLRGNFSPADSSNTSKKVRHLRKHANSTRKKKKLGAQHTMLNVLPLECTKISSLLDEELGLPFVKTRGVRKAHGDDTRRSDPRPRRSGRMWSSVQRLTYDSSSLCLHDKGNKSC